MIARLRQASPQLLLYFLGVAFAGVASTCFNASYNNFLDDVFHIGADARGVLEFPRELPGFLVALMTGALAFLPETRVAAVSMLVTFAGMIGLGGVDLNPTARHAWEWMIFYTLLWAAGSHLVMPVQSSIGMSLAPPSRHGRRLGQVSAVGAAASILGSVFVWAVSANRTGPPYWLIFGAGGVVALASGFTFLSMRGIGRQTARPRLVHNRRYGLYYVLSLLFGARKQLFITFGPWVLIKVFGQKVPTFAKLGIVNAVLTMFTNPAIGTLIDKWGERRTLVLEGLLLVLVCAGYGVAHLVGPWGLYLAFACFVLDQVMFGFGNARTTYLAKIAERPEDVTASLSLGISLDHAVSMSLPTLGGLVWVRYGHMWVFVGGAVLSLVYALCATFVRVPSKAAAASSAGETRADEPAAPAS
ncbi:MFS transporter [bacterium]|nr:MFS transporter [bacterium]